MRIQQSSHQGCAVLTLVGRLDSAAAPPVQRTILKQLAEQPPAAEDGQTTITGPVVDQAHLHGLLDRVRDLGLELVSVNAAFTHPLPTTDSPNIA